MTSPFPTVRTTSSRPQIPSASLSAAAFPLIDLLSLASPSLFDAADRQGSLSTPNAQASLSPQGTARTLSAILQSALDIIDDDDLDF